MGMLVDVQQGFRHRDIEVLASPSATTLHKCCQDASGGFHPGVHIPVAERVIGICASAHVTLVFGESYFGVHHRRVGAAINPRARSPITTD